MNSLTAFLDKLRDEPALQQRLSAIFALPEAERIPAFRALSQEFGVPESELSLALPAELSETDLANVSGGHSSIVAAAGDEVSAAVAALFASHSQAYQSISAQAAAFHSQFVQAIQSSAQNHS